MVRPTRIHRPRELLSVESAVGDVSGTDVDWGTSPIGIPASSGRDQWKQPVRVASTASVTVSTALNNGDTIDGVTLVTGDRVLLKDQSTGSQNGIYIVGATPIRAADMDDDDEVLGALVYVIAGTTNTATAWKVTNTAAITVGSTSIVWAAFGTGGSASFATPAIVLGSSAAAGAASTVIRSDATIAAFDATVPVTQAYSDTAATGSVAFAARRDHRHGMPASGGGGSTTGVGWIDSATNPDKVPGSPSAQDDEFEAGSLDVKWTHTGAGTLAFADSKMVITHAASATDELFMQAYVPGAGVAFTLTMRVTGITFQESVDYFGFVVQDVGGSSISTSDLRATAQNTFQLNKDNPGGAATVTVAPPGGGAFYLRLARDASNVYSFSVSLDGVAYSGYGIATGTSSTAVTKVGFRFGQTATRSYKLASIDWFRRT